MSWHESPNPLTNKAPIHQKVALKKDFFLNKSNIKPINNILIKKKNTVLELKNILKKYDKLSSGEMDPEEKILFSRYLLNLYNKAYKTTKNPYVGRSINLKTLNVTLNLLKSNDIHEKVIGIDNFMGLQHTLGLFLPSLVSVNNGIEIEKIKHGLDWHLELSKLTAQVLDTIRNRRGN